MFTDIEERAVTQAARSVRARFHGYVDQDDLQQEARLWLLEHPDKVREWLDQGAARAERALVKALDRFLTRYAMVEKAARIGAKVDDFYQYRRGEVEYWLTELFLGDTDAQEVTIPTGRRSVNGHRSGSVQAAMPAAVELFDVKAAYEKLDTDQQYVLLAFYGQRKDADRVAGEYDVTKNAILMRRMRALRAIQRLLNGATRV